MIGERLLMMLSGILFFQILPLKSQTIKTKNLKKISFYESITFVDPVDYSTQISGMLRLFDLPGYNSEEYLETLRKQKILKKQAGKYWFRIPIQEDFGKDAVCYMIFDSTLWWFGGFKPFAWSKDGKNKREPKITVWAEYVITPDKGFTLANSNILDYTGYANVDMSSFYGNLNGAHLSFDKRKKPKPKRKK